MESADLLLQAGYGWKEGLVGKALLKGGKNSFADYTLLSSGLSAIIQGKERPFGILEAHSLQNRPFANSDINFLQSIANILAEATEKKEAEKDLREARDFLEMHVKERTSDLKNVNVRLQEEIAERLLIEGKFKTALREKDVLLKEIHHRSKNNLQLISSLLQLQSREISDDHYVEVFMESCNRIKSIAVMHDLIFQSPTLDRIDTHLYFTSIAQNLFDSYANTENIELDIRTDGISLNVDTCIYFGLIIN